MFIDYQVQILMSDRQPTLTEKAGGRKALGFYSALACCFILAIMDKAHAEVLGLIDTLFFIYAGANVMAKKATKPPEKKDIINE